MLRRFRPTRQRAAAAAVTGIYQARKITALVLGWVEDSALRSDSPELWRLRLIRGP